MEIKANSNEIDCRKDTINQITNKLPFITLSFLKRWNNNAHTNKYGKNSDNVREPSAPARRLKLKLYNIQ